MLGESFSNVASPHLRSVSTDESGSLKLRVLLNVFDENGNVFVWLLYSLVFRYYDYEACSRGRSPFGVDIF